jgi:hypothetical protein
MRRYKKWHEKMRLIGRQEEESTLPSNILNKDRGQPDVSRHESGGTQATSTIIPNGGGGEPDVSRRESGGAQATSLPNGDGTQANISTPESDTMFNDTERPFIPIPESDTTTALIRATECSFNIIFPLSTVR